MGINEGRANEKEGNALQALLIEDTHIIKILVFLIFLKPFYSVVSLKYIKIWKVFSERGKE